MKNHSLSFPFNVSLLQFNDVLKELVVIPIQRLLFVAGTLPRFFSSSIAIRKNSSCWLWLLLLDLPNPSVAVSENDSPVISSFVVRDQRHQNLHLYDRHDKLSSHVLVYPLDRPPPVEILDPRRHRRGHRNFAVSGDALEAVFPNYRDQDDDDNDWMVACLEKGTDRSVAGHTLPEKHYRPSTVPMTIEQQREDFNNWFWDNCDRVEVCLSNFYNHEPLVVYWIHHSTGEPQFHMTIPYGQVHMQCFFTYLGHSFRITSPSSRGQDEEELLDEFTMEYTMVKNYGQSPQSAHLSQFGSIEREIDRTLGIEWERRKRVQRTFSSLGFAKGKLPADVFASMSSYFYNNRFEKVREDWGNQGVFVNWWETQAHRINIPFHLKSIWQSRLADLVSTWADVPVEQTIMYGMRQYETHARLLPHVDRLETHAISLIVNVAQGGLEEPWPIEILDHAGRVHEITLQPGEIVYYESAKNLHARTRPLKGKNAYYVNLFTHYRPLGDGDLWYTQPTSENVPPPLLDVKGKCELQFADSVTETPTGQLGMVQFVHCDDPRLGPYISPTLFQVQSLDDLKSWWHGSHSESIHKEDAAVASSSKARNEDITTRGGRLEEDMEPTSDNHKEAKVPTTSTGNDEL